MQFEQRLRQTAQRWNPDLPESELVRAFKTELSHIGLCHAVGNARSLNETFSKARNYKAVQETKKKESERDKASLKADKKKNVATPQLVLPLDKSESKPNLALEPSISSPAFPAHPFYWPYAPSLTSTYPPPFAPPSQVLAMDQSNH